MVEQASPVPCFVFLQLLLHLCSCGAGLLTAARALLSFSLLQLVRAGDPTERVVLQFGKAEQDAFILDFNPMVLTASQAFGIVLSTFDSKLFL
jgi:hypothetical protein